MKVHNLTVCDQVRQEVNGKFFLIGVYSNGIILPQLPTTFAFSVWMLLETERLGRAKFKIRARMPEHDTELFIVEGEAEIVDIENWTPLGIGTNVIIGQPGILTIEAMFDDDSEWSILRTLYVKKGQPGDFHISAAR